MSKMRQKLNLITLGVTDLNKSIEFYEKGLGWKRSEQSVEGMILYPLGGITLALYPRDDLAKDATVDNLSTGFSGITLSYNAKSEGEVDSVLKLVARCGGSIIKPAKIVFWGGYSGYFKDPDGHIFEVAFNPFWDFDDNDNLIL